MTAGRQGGARSFSKGSARAYAPSSPISGIVAHNTHKYIDGGNRRKKMVFLKGECASSRVYHLPPRPSGETDRLAMFPSRLVASLTPIPPPPFTIPAVAIEAAAEVEAANQPARVPACLSACLPAVGAARRYPYQSRRHRTASSNSGAAAATAEATRRRSYYLMQQLKQQAGPG